MIFVIYIAIHISGFGILKRILQELYLHGI